MSRLLTTIQTKADRWDRSPVCSACSTRDEFVGVEEACSGAMGSTDPRCVAAVGRGDEVDRVQMQVRPAHRGRAGAAPPAQTFEFVAEREGVTLSTVTGVNRYIGTIVNLYPCQPRLTTPG